MKESALRTLTMPSDFTTAIHAFPAISTPTMPTERQPITYYLFAAIFGLFVLFLYGPMLTIFILSLQGPQGSLTFPMRGFGFSWLSGVFEDQIVGSFVEPFGRSLLLGLMVAVLTVVLALFTGLAFRKPFRGATPLFYLTIASLIVPGILISLGIGLLFELMGQPIQWYSTALAGHLTWTLPFAFLIVLGIFNRFNPSYEEAARDLGASRFASFRNIVLPLIAPSLLGVAILSFTLSYDEFTRTSLIAGENNTLPLEIFGMTTNVTKPTLYAFGTVTTAVSFALVGLAIASFQYFSQRRGK